MNIKASLLVKVIPQSKENKIIGWEGEILKIRIHAVAQKGEANRELIRFLAKAINLPQRSIILVQGETSPIKKLLFEGITQKDLLNRLK